MDELIQKLTEATQGLVKRIGEAEYEDLVEFVEYREQVIVQMKQWQQSNKLEPKHREAIAQLEAYDAQIRAKMTMLRNEASLKLKQMSQAQASRSAYEAEQPMDSHFFDRRK